MSNSKQQAANSTNEDASANFKPNPTILYSFPEQGKGKWRIQNDVVMGGRSESQLKMTDNKNAHFTGQVSLENNGGFCSIHQTVENDPYEISEKSNAFVLRLNGDGKDYNFRVRTKNGRHAYAFTFPTQGDGNWESISIPFNKMAATYRGNSVDVPNYAGETVVEMQLLIGNGKEETFEILIESIGII